MIIYFKAPSMLLRILINLFRGWTLAHMLVHCATINRISSVWSGTTWNPNIILILSHTTASFVTKSLGQIRHFKFTRTGITSECLLILNIKLKYVFKLI